MPGRGGALNCVSNGKILRDGPFRDIWIQPAAGDAGGAIGAAVVAWHHYEDKDRTVSGSDNMRGGYLGPKYEVEEIREQLDSCGAIYAEKPSDKLLSELASLLNKEKMVGWFQGRMEFGPRALGARSIIGDVRSAAMQSVMNLKIKYRESFRPFAPSVLAERVSDYFEQDRPSPRIKSLLANTDEHVEANGYKGNRW